VDYSAGKRAAKRPRPRWRETSRARSLFVEPNPRPVRSYPTSGLPRASSSCSSSTPPSCRRPSGASPTPGDGPSAARDEISGRIDFQFVETARSLCLKFAYNLYAGATPAPRPLSTRHTRSRTITPAPPPLLLASASLSLPRDDHLRFPPQQLVHERVRFVHASRDPHAVLREKLGERRALRAHLLLQRVPHRRGSSAREIVLRRRFRILLDERLAVLGDAAKDVTASGVVGFRFRRRPTATVGSRRRRRARDGVDSRAERRSHGRRQRPRRERARAARDERHHARVGGVAKSVGTDDELAFEQPSVRVVREQTAVVLFAKANRARLCSNAVGRSPPRRVTPRHGGSTVPEAATPRRVGDHRPRAARLRSVMQSHEAKRQRVEKPRASSENVLPFPSTSVAETNDADERYDADANNSPSRHTPGRTPGARRLRRALDRSHPDSRLDRARHGAPSRAGRVVARTRISPPVCVSRGCTHFSRDAPLERARRRPTLSHPRRWRSTGFNIQRSRSFGDLGVESAERDGCARDASREISRVTKSWHVSAVFENSNPDAHARATSPLANAHADSTTYPLIDPTGSNAVNQNSRRRPRTGTRAGMTF